MEKAQRMIRNELPEVLQDRLEDFETQYGQTSGKLALAMELITDAEIAAGHLTVYCRNGLDPRKPHPDLESLQRHIHVIRALIKEAFRAERGAPKE